MPKNNSKKKKAVEETKKRILVYKGDMEEYGQITKMLGDLRVMVLLPDRTELMAIIPGRFRRRCWMKVGDVVLISRREYQDSKIDICYKYNEDEIRKLVSYYEIPSFFEEIIDENTETAENYFEFQTEGDDDIIIEEEGTGLKVDFDEI